MGCDIHMHIEYKKDGEWKEYMWREDYRKSDGEMDWKSYFEDKLNLGRDYDLFAMLADVRNGYGFAGVDTGDAVVPIALPKGIPNDVSQTVLADAEAWDCDGHSHSYLTLKDILDYDWSQTITHRGFLHKDDYEKYIIHGKPVSYCAGTSAPKCTEKQMKKHIFKNKIYNKAVQLEWKETYAECVEYFLKDFIPAIKEAFPNHSDEDLRLVFWFDN